jgi:single-stranded-DNA-specific exonuclease
VTAAALKYAMTESGAPPAFLGVECSVRGYRWVERLEPAQSLTAAAIAQSHDLPELLARVLAARGADQRSVDQYLDPSLRDLLPDPASLRDMERAAERFVTAIRNNEPIAVLGDYDVDGAASVALIERFLRAHGQTATTYIPDRLTEGYGPNAAALDQLASDGARLILTVDCGTNSVAAIDAASAKGIEIIVIDHHQADDALPQALAVVNPNRQDDLSGQGHLAAAGVVFLFLVAATRVLRGQGAYFERAEPDLLGLLDLVALATVCDVVPLKGVNRAFVAKGLAVLRLRQNAGLRALADSARVDGVPTCYTLGFILGPRINAGGRVGSSSLGARLLTCDDDIEARGIAGQLEALNTERKAIEETMLEEAFALAETSLEAEPDRSFLCLGAESWHKGLIGLIASRLVERFRLPAFVIAWEPDGLGTGSARSIAGVDLGQAVRAAVHAGLLLKGGGHTMAAGFKLDRRKADALSAFLSEQLSDSVAHAMSVKTLAIDGALASGGASKEFVDLLDRAGPYGMGHPAPLFVFPFHRLLRVRSIKGAHMRCTLQASDGARIEACAFRIAETPLGALLQKSDGLRLHVAGRLRRNIWNGRESIELHIEDAAKPGPAAP